MSAQPEWFSTFAAVFSKATAKALPDQLSGTFLQFLMKNVSSPKSSGSVKYYPPLKSWFDNMSGTNQSKFDNFWQIYEKLKLDKESKQDRQKFLALPEIFYKIKSDPKMAEFDWKQFGAGILNTGLDVVGQIIIANNTPNGNNGGYNGSGINPPSVTPPPFDLGDYFKLPTVETGLDGGTKNMMYIIVGALALVFLIKK